MSLEELKGERIHDRRIRVEAFKVDDERIIVEGSLDDTRHVVSYTLSGGRREPGPIHGMVVRLLIGGLPPQILDAEVEMPKAPLPECNDARDSIKKLVGLPVVYGFSKAVKDRMGGTAGCNHLTALVLTIGSAVMQGFAINRGGRPLPDTTKTVMLGYLKNSCVVWSEDGEHYNKLFKETE